MKRWHCRAFGLFSEGFDSVIHALLYLVSLRVSTSLNLSWKMWFCTSTTLLIEFVFSYTRKWNFRCVILRSSRMRIKKAAAEREKKRNEVAQLRTLRVFEKPLRSSTNISAFAYPIPTLLAHVYPRIEWRSLYSGCTDRYFVYDRPFRAGCTACGYALESLKAFLFFFTLREGCFSLLFSPRSFIVSKKYSIARARFQW